MKNVNNDYIDALLRVLDRVYMEAMVTTKYNIVDVESLYDLVTLMKYDKIRIMQFDDNEGGDNH